MGRQYDRIIELHIYTLGIKTIIKRDLENESLDIEFATEATSSTNRKKSPNKAVIKVYNLNKSNQSLFSEEHQAVELYAGYADDFGMIFIGQTTNVITSREGVSTVTTIHAGDGIKDWTTRFFNKSYSAGTLVSQVLQDMVDATGLPSTIDTLDIDTLLAGENYTGLVKDVLSDFTRDRGLEWSIQWGVVEVTQKDTPLVKDPISIVLRPDTGLIGEPSLVERTTKNKKKTTGKKRRTGVRATALLNHNIRPKRLVTIESPNKINAVGKLSTDPAPNVEINGVYEVDSVKFFGSNSGKEFYVEIEADLQ